MTLENVEPLDDVSEDVVGQVAASLDDYYTAVAHIEADPGKDYGSHAVEWNKVEDCG